MRRKTISILFYALAVYVLFILYLFVAQRSFIYFPDDNMPSPAVYGVPEMRVIEVNTADGLVLKSWYKPPSDSKMPVVLLFHGNAGHIGFRAFKVRDVINQGFGFMLAEYRGYGGNPGKVGEEGFYHDGRAHIEWLEEQGISPARIVLYGESLGTGVAVQMATEYEVAGLILETPFTSLPSLAQKYIFYAPIKPFVKDIFHNVAKMGTVGAPLLVLHGQADFVVPYRQGVSVFEAANDPKVLETFPFGGHNDLYMHGAGGAVMKFLDALGGTP